MGSGKRNPKYQYFKKTSIDVLVFQYANYLLVLFIYNQINLETIKNTNQ